MFHSKIPCGKFAGSGASGSKKLSLKRSLIDEAGPAPVFPSATFCADVWYLASANTIPSSVVWSVLSTSSHAAPVVVTATWFAVFVELRVAAVLYL